MPHYSPTELEALVRRRGPEIAADITAAARRSRNEADLVAEVERIIEKFARNFDVSLNLSRERTLVNGRADAVYNRFVIEYEPPGSLRKSPDYRHNVHAVGQVKQYMDGLERLDRHRKERLAGVVLDGSFYIFVRFRDGHWRIDDPVPVGDHSTETFLRYLLSLSTELALTPDNLERDFGENSNVARAVMPALYRALRATADPRTRILFDQWRRQFSEITGYEKGSAQLDVVKLAKSYAVADPAPDAESLFFALHTYYATFIKLLAVQIATYYLMPRVGAGLAQVAAYDSDRLRDYLLKMERGGVFADFGIKNFLEGDFFAWYLDIWDGALDAALRRLIGDLANYSLVTLDVDPEETRDLLKQLYQNLMPRKLRHALGEYYTPDWLAERLLNQLGYDGNPSQRLLDPACGSGTFLVLALKRVRAYAEERMLPPGRVLDQALENVVGFDLNPLAVISARTNYLLALGDLLPHRTGDINIPVYLADSILTPSLETSGEGQLSWLDAAGAKARQPGFSFNTAVGKFTVPKALVDARYIDAFAALLEECVDVGLTEDLFRRRLLGGFPLDEAKDAGQIDLALALYRQLVELHAQGIDGIWARIIKNAFAPLFQGRFDFVAGNPPWVNWESLPRHYRESLIPLYQDIYHLFVHKGTKARHGSAKIELSSLVFYVAVDQYLVPRGKLGFVITEALFKTDAGKGFRRFNIGDAGIKVIQVDDMVEIKPFEGASNRTSVVVAQKGAQTRFPVPYFNWRKVRSGRIGEDYSLEEVLKAVKVKKLNASPVDDDDPMSEWLCLPSSLETSVRKVTGSSSYSAKPGVCTWLNGVFWVETIAVRPDGLTVVANLSDSGKREVLGVQSPIEPALLYPLLRGRDVRRWLATPSAYQIIPHDPTKPGRGYSEEAMPVKFPHAYRYFKEFKHNLTDRAGYRKYLEPNGVPFYSVYNIGDYTFAPWKVVWREQAAGLTVSVIGSEDGRVVVPDHKLMLVPFDNEQAAHFLCAALNSSPARMVVQSYGVTIQMDTHVLENVRVPAYDATNATHRALAALSQDAHTATAAGDTTRVAAIEAEIDRLAARLWGLTAEELRDIQESLAELQ